MTARKSWSVRPRFTPGSPGLVNEATALHVAAQEREGYRHALAGRYGPKQKLWALEQGVKGIVIDPDGKDLLDDTPSASVPELAPRYTGDIPPYTVEAERLYKRTPKRLLWAATLSAFSLADPCNVDDDAEGCDDADVIKRLAAELKVQARLMAGGDE